MPAGTAEAIHDQAAVALQVRTTHVQFDGGANQPADNAQPGSPVRFNLRSRSRVLHDHLHEVTLELVVDCHSGDGSAWHLEIHVAGAFDLTAVAPPAATRTLNTRCARALLPFAKRIADSLVREGGFPPFDLPPVDFVEAYERYQRTRSADAPLAALSAFWQAVRHLQAIGQQKQQPASFHAVHGEALAVAQRSRDVLPAADQVLASDPHDESTLHALAAAYSMNGLHRQTLRVYTLAVAARPDDARARYNLATALMFNGDLRGAEREIATSIRLQPALWDAYTVRSQVRRQTAADNHIDELKHLLDRNAGVPQGVERLHLALGKEYGDVGAYARAFAHLAAGNRIGKLRRHYNWARDAQMFDALLTHAPTPTKPTDGCPSAEPIFVFGMPRSGTTLVDRILSTHPDVESAGELKQFGMLLKYICGSPTEPIIDADTVGRAQALDWRELGEQYVANTRPVTGHTRRFIDKFPHHFLYAGHLANALPNATLICVRRNPLDTCFANFRQVFSEASPFHGYACDLLDAGRYFVAFDTLMRYWRLHFPGRILEMSYEKLVEQPETAARSLLAFCGLEWNPACLRFDQNPAPVATASAVEVRRPLYRDAVGRWRHYARELAPLAELLAQAGIEVDGA